MPTLSRALRRWRLHVVAAATLAAAWLAVLIAFGYAAVSAAPDVKTIGAALLLLGIAATAFLYAWREPGA